MLECFTYAQSSCSWPSRASRCGARGGQAGENPGASFLDPEDRGGPRLGRAAETEEPLPLDSASLVVILQNAGSGSLVTQNVSQTGGQLLRFQQADVHTLHAGRPGLVRGITREPSMALAKTLCVAMFEFHVG